MFYQISLLEGRDSLTLERVKNVGDCLCRLEEKGF